MHIQTQRDFYLYLYNYDNIFTYQTISSAFHNRLLGQLCQCIRPQQLQPSEWVRSRRKSVPLEHSPSSCRPKRKRCGTSANWTDRRRELALRLIKYSADVQLCPASKLAVGSCWGKVSAIVGVILVLNQSNCNLLLCPLKLNYFRIPWGGMFSIFNQTENLWMSV